MKDLTNDFMCDHEIGVALVNGNEVYFSEMRINLSDVPEGFYRYEVRGSDKDGSWATIEKNVVVNFVATILSEEEFDLEKHIWFNPYTNSDGVDYYTDIKDCKIIESFDC